MVRFFAIATVWFVAALAVLFSLPAPAQTPHQEHAQDIPMHDRFYENWKIAPERVTSCCNKNDCYPTPFKFDGSNWYALRREDQLWVRIPWERLEQNQPEDNIRESPDFQSHVCMPNPFVGDGTTVYCATLGSGN